MPLQAPIARDDRVTSAQTMGKTAVDVPVLKNDEDPDGVGENLKISTDATTARPGAEGNMIVDLTEQPQLIPYTVEDVDGQKSTAIIWVPGIGQQVPTLAKDEVIEVIAGQSVTVDLKEWVKVRDGRSPRLTQTDRIKLIGADGGDPVAGNGTALNYTAGTDYVGPGSLSFEVTDGTGPDDPDGLKSTLSIRTKVLPDPNRNNPPTLLGSQVDVPKGESADTDLGRLTADPDRDDVENMKYELVGGQPGRLQRQHRRQDPEDVGRRFNGHRHDRRRPGQGQGSTRTGSHRHLPAGRHRLQPAQAGGQRRPRAQRGRRARPVTVNVLANDSNPFPETPLKIVAAATETGSGSVEVAGDSVTVTPAPGFTGTLVVSYTVADKTGEASRQATARIRLTVKDKPLAPTTPQAQSVGDQTALLNWTAPADRGSPITKYTVYGEGGFQQDCPANTCTLNGLVNNTKYHFQVDGHERVRRVGPVPGLRRGPPGRQARHPCWRPALKFGDKQLAVAWVGPGQQGLAGQVL